MRVRGGFSLFSWFPVAWFSVVVAAGVGVGPASAQPLVKSGPCPAFTRTPTEMPFGFQNNTMQVALTPAQSVNCIETPAGFQSQLWASEEDAGNIKAIIAFTFDARGRMWAVESFDYPNVVKTPFAGRDRIVILEDADHDGRVDKASVFAEGFNIAQGLEWTPDGLVVAMSPYLLLLEDKNGDDKADDPKGKILFQGFNKTNPGDTHGTISNLHFAMDGWVYGMSGYNGGTVNGIKFGSGIFRFRSDGSKFEFLATTSNNSWGIGLAEDGQVFGSTANCDESDHLVMPGLAVQKMRLNDKIHPLTQDVTQHSCVGLFTAAAGHDMYTARLFPKEYIGRAAFVCEPTGHLVAQFFNDPNGSSWKSTADTTRWNIFASTDAWTSPIAAKVGPDGALWVLDWYTYIIQHNGDPVGPGGAFITDLRDKKYCRIHRVVPTGKPLETWPALANATVAQLIAAYAHPNLLWRLQAERLLLAKAKVDAGVVAQAEPLLTALLDRRSKDEAGNDPPLLHALWTLKEMGRFEATPAKWNPILAKLLLHPSGGVRANVLKAMPRTLESSQAIKDHGRVNDPDAHVRIQALLALGAINPKAAGILQYHGYRVTDDGNGAQPHWADTAFKAADIGETPTLPAVPALDPVVAVRRVQGGDGNWNWEEAWHAGFRLRAAAGGAWALPIHPGLPAGELILMDARGRVLDRAGFDGAGWNKAAVSAGTGVAFYEFHGHGITGRDGGCWAGRFAAALQ